MQTAKRVLLNSRTQFSIDRSGRNPRQVIINNTEFIEFLVFSDILYVKAESNYSRFVMKDGREFLSCKTLGHYETALCRGGFIRPHQSYLVNRDGISRVRKAPEYTICMGNAIEIPVSRSRKKSVLESLIGTRSTTIAY